MTSTSPSDFILKIEGLNLIYKSYLYEKNSLKGSFIKGLKGVIKKEKAIINSLHVLQDLNLSLKKGDRLGILGHNGSGKTTLCRCISGMLSPTTGSVEVRGLIRSVFNTTIGLMPELTGRENAYLLSALIFPEISLLEREELLEDALAFSELGNFLDTPFINYSKGMQARLCLSLISARRCDLLILDEVFDGADIPFQKKIAVRILKLIEDSGSSIFVSHNLEQIRSACNQVAVIEKGKVWFRGGVEEGIKLYLALD